MPLVLLIESFAVDLCAAGVALVLTVSAAHQLAHIERTSKAIDGYQLLPRFLLPLVALGLPCTEFVAAVGLVVPATQRAGAVLGFVLLSIVTTAVVINLLRGRRDIDCGCVWRRASPGLSWPLVVRNGAFLAMSGLVAGFPGASGQGTEAHRFASVLGAATLVTLVAVARQLAANQSAVTSSRRTAG
jgi:hypothetical protein